MIVRLEEHEKEKVVLAMSTLSWGFRGACAECLPAGVELVDLRRDCLDHSHL